MLVFEDGIIKTPDFQFNENCGGIGCMLFEYLKKYSDRIALLNTFDDNYLTYEQLFQKTVSAAVALQKRGIKPKDLIAICSNRENLEANIPIIAAQFLGCVTFSIDPTMSFDEILELVKQVQPKLIFVIHDAKQIIKEVFQECNYEVDLIEFGLQFQSEFLQFYQEFQPLFIKNLQETCMIHFSSGSTGTPKPICLNHYYFLVFIHEGIDPTNHRTTSVSLRTSNWYWVSASMEMISFISDGGCRLLQDKMCIQKLWFIVEKYKVTHLMLTPLHCIELTETPKPTKVDTSSLLKISIGGYVLHKEYMIKLRQLLPGVHIMQTYGMTECGINTIFNENIPYHRKLLHEKPDSCGLPVNGLYYKVVDLNTGKNCGPNQQGELYLKGRKLFTGFHNQDSSASFDKDGFFATGDLVYFDNDFCFFIVDRIKAVLGWNDWLIYPSHIEQVLFSHPAVFNAMVIGIPHKIEGERLMGVVILKESSAGKVKEEELVKYVEDRVEDHKRLREGLVFVKEFPTTITGKANRLKVKEMIVKNLH
ncbi:unnamed protein product [Ceutorhynchus assimilis]|uniref:Uncharacterized protein n=1 Tax=Ceutorhynchus assimilis TaxID=467358 RepID=A0A9N9MRC2_9CUCU|nr:unnamed protein product [Ceutorhynchus assimilis]